MFRKTLSKTKLLSARQCLKRLYLEVHKPGLRQYSARAEAAFEIGHQVGALVHDIYGSDEAVLIPYEGGLSHALRKTARLVRQGPGDPIFEATFEHGGVLVRIDALLPDGDGWRIVEIKSSTKLKDYHAFDCAVQAWVFQALGHCMTGIALAHVDNTFVYGGDGEYRGLLVERDMGEQVAALSPAVPEWIARARDAAAGDEPDIGVGAQCNKPFDCPFMHHCWPDATPYPVQDLPRASLARLGEYVDEGITDLRDVPGDRLTATQLRVQRVARSGQAERLPAAKDFVTALDYPRYYLDFETIATAIPVWPGTRPYETLPFQWSCHFEAIAGQVEHADFLDLTGEPPMRRFAESLIRVLGAAGPVIVYTSYEKRVIGGLIERFPDLEAPLASILDRLVDLAPVTAQNYYHPQMAGSWSLKAVLPAVAPDMEYEKLEGIQDGMAASKGYLEAIDEATPPGRKNELKDQLETYCKFDTEALVRLVRFFSG